MAEIAPGAGALYVCYLGMRDPLVHAQVLPYLRELAHAGVRTSLLTFEPRLESRWPPAERTAWRSQLLADGIRWHCRPYHQRPTLPATLYDIVTGGWHASRIARREGLTIFHGRSDVGAAVASIARRLTRAGRVIFDLRGLLAEEYVGIGRWRAGGYMARIVNHAERALLRSADGVVILTERARTMLEPVTNGTPVEVIPCCVDLARFAGSSQIRDAVRRTLGVGDGIVCVFAGSVGGAYSVDDLARFLNAARGVDPRVYGLILTTSPLADVRAAFDRHGLPPASYHVAEATPDEVPRYLAAADIGLAFVRPARLAASPTKLAEYLAAGLPIVTTKGVGDLDDLVNGSRVGALLEDLEPHTCATAFAAVQQLRREPDLRARCEEAARTRFDLKTVGGPRYRRLYDAVLRSRPLRVLALASYPVEAASSRFRLTQFIEPLRARAIDVRFAPFLDRSLFAAFYRPKAFLRHLPRLILAICRRTLDLAGAVRSDVVFVQREAMLFGPPIFEWIVARVLRRPLVLDLDDPTYLPQPSLTYGRLAKLLKWAGKTDTLIDDSRIVLCGSPAVASYARSRHARVEVLGSIVDTGVYRPSHEPHTTLRIGWIGTHTTFPFLERLFPVFRDLARELPFELHIVGSGCDTVSVPGVDVHNRAWSLDREPEDFRSLDIGVYPLPDTTWNAGKSGLKAVQYLASGVPFVMSPVGVCTEIGIAGQTHLRAVTDAEWYLALKRLATDAAVRTAMGRTGREYAVARYSIDQRADRLAAILREVS